MDEIKPPNFLTLVAKRKITTEGWEPFNFKSIVGGVIVTGGKSKPIQRGKYKGTLRYEKPHTEVFVSSEEIKKEHTEYCKQNNFCYHCCGQGKTWAGWSKSEGNRFKPCEHCAGLGSPFKGAP